MTDIFETCESINEYLEEKEKLIDKVYGKEAKNFSDADIIAMIAQHSKLPNSFVTKKLMNREEAKDALVGKLDRNYAKYLKKPGAEHNPTTRNELMRALMNRADFKNKALVPEHRDAIKYLKKELGAGLDNMPSEKEPGKYLKVQKAIDKVTGVKRESADARLNVYEAFEAGLITEFEKDELLNILNTYEE